MTPARRSCARNVRKFTLPRKTVVKSQLGKVATLADWLDRQLPPSPQAPTMAAPMAKPMAEPMPVPEVWDMFYAAESPTTAAPMSEPTPTFPAFNASLVRIFYCTDRREASTLPLSYDEGRSSGGQLHYGTCEISIPKYRPAVLD
jgi:hypothetical protein